MFNSACTRRSLAGAVPSDGLLTCHFAGGSAGAVAAAAVGIVLASVVGTVDGEVVARDGLVAGAVVASGFVRSIVHSSEAAGCVVGCVVAARSCAIAIRLTCSASIVRARLSRR